MVGVNVPIPGADGVPLFRWLEALAVRRRCNVHGADGVRFYTRLKTVTSRWPTGHAARTREFVMPTMK